MPLFRDRRDAGARLAERLDHLRAEEPIVLGLPRGGVPVAFEVASRLAAPLGPGLGIKPHADVLGALVFVR